jgi:hypothetical protein
MPIYCPICSQTFESEQTRDEHVRARTCPELPPKQWDGITESQKTQLKQRVSSCKTREENWYIIYGVLFPGAALPKSPYLDPPLSEGLLELQEFAAQEGPAIIRELGRTQMPLALRFVENDVQAYTTALFQNALDILLQRFENQASTGQAVSRHEPHPSSSSISDSGYSSSSRNGSGQAQQETSFINEVLAPSEPRWEDPFTNFFVDWASEQSAFHDLESMNVSGQNIGA